jgi:hypothetical protein
MIEQYIIDVFHEVEVIFDGERIANKVLQLVFAQGRIRHDKGWELALHLSDFNLCLGLADSSIGRIGVGALYVCLVL